MTLSQTPRSWLDVCVSLFGFLTTGEVSELLSGSVARIKIVLSTTTVRSTTTVSGTSAVLDFTGVGAVGAVAVVVVVVGVVVVVDVGVAWVVLPAVDTDRGVARAGSGTVAPCDWVPSAVVVVVSRRATVLVVAAISDVSGRQSFTPDQVRRSPAASATRNHLNSFDLQARFAHLNRSYDRTARTYRVRRKPFDGCAGRRMRAQRKRGVVVGAAGHPHVRIVAAPRMSNSRRHPFMTAEVQCAVSAACRSRCPSAVRVPALRTGVGDSSAREGVTCGFARPRLHGWVQLTPVELSSRTCGPALHLVREVVRPPSLRHLIQHERVE
jgi:hypothetical protein